MTWRHGALLAVAWLVMLLSAFAVINSTHISRQKVNELEVLRRESERLQAQWGQYLLEESAWAAYSRIESVAKQKLKMKTPDPSDSVMVVK